MQVLVWASSVNPKHVLKTLKFIKDAACDVKMEMAGCVVVFSGGKGLKMLCFPGLNIPNLRFALSEKCCYIHFFFLLLVSDLWLMGRDCFPYSVIRLPTSLSLSNCPERKKSMQLKFIAYILPPAPLCLILRFNSLFSLNRGLSPQRLTRTHTMSMLNRSLGLILATCLCTRQTHTHAHTPIP